MFEIEKTKHKSTEMKDFNSAFNNSEISIELAHKDVEIFYDYEKNSVIKQTD